MGKMLALMLLSAILPFKAQALDIKLNLMEGEKTVSVSEKFARINVAKQVRLSVEREYGEEKKCAVVMESRTYDGNEWGSWENGGILWEEDNLTEDGLEAFAAECLKYDLAEYDDGIMMTVVEKRVKNGEGLEYWWEQGKYLNVLYRIHMAY